MRTLAIIATVLSLSGCQLLFPPARQQHQPLIDYASRKIEENPGDLKAYKARAEAYVKRGDLAQAAADYGRMIDMAPDEATGYLGRARCNNYGLTKRGGNWAGLSAAYSPADPLHIQSDLDKAIALNPDYDRGSAYFIRGGIRLIQFRDDEANADFGEYLRRNPNLSKDVETTIASLRKERDAAPKDNFQHVRQEQQTESRGRAGGRSPQTR